MQISFSGKVYMNYTRTAEQIDKMPYGSHGEIIANINDLQSFLKNDTPKDKTWVLTVDAQKTSPAFGAPFYHYAIIKVKDEKGESATCQVRLGQTGGSEKYSKTSLRSYQAMKINEFRQLREQVAQGELVKLESDEEAINETIKKEVSQTSLPEKLGLSVEEISELVRPIYDSILDGAKVGMDKAYMAVSIWRTTRHPWVPEEIKESLISNLNTMIRRLEEETPKDTNPFISTYTTTDGSDKVIGISALGKRFNIEISKSPNIQYLNPICATDSDSITRKFDFATNSMLGITDKNFDYQKALIGKLL